MDQETIERLLVGPVADAPDGPEALVRLLTAVRAAPRPHELTGERAAVQAFRTARSGSVVRVPARSRRRILAGALGAKVALAALLAAATGGVAFAAVTGTLPGPLSGGDTDPTPPVASTGERPSPTAAPDPSSAAPDATSGRPGSSPALRGLCTAYGELSGEDRRRALESARFRELRTVAGGPEKVAGYCDRLLDDGRGRTTNPAGGASSRPGGEPTERATGKPERTATAPVTPGTPATTAGRPDGPAGNQRQTTTGPGTH
jgi:hypothetical protein